MVSLIKEFFRDIYKNIGRFLSLFFIVLLGTSFFSGLRSTGYDMKYSADKYYDKQNTMDIQVLGTLGITDKDVSDIKAVPGVENAEAVYSKDVISLIKDKESVLKILSDTKEINSAYIIEGRLPKGKSECMVDAGALATKDIAIGERISVYVHDEDEDIEDSLNTTEFTVVGRGFLPYYTELYRGQTNIGDGTLDGFLLVDKSVFAAEAYSEIYITVENAKKEINLSKKYKKIISPVKEAIEKKENSACNRRYYEVINEANEDIYKGQRDIYKGWQEIENAKAELIDAESKLKDGWIELREAETKINDGQAQLDEGRSTLNAKRDEIMAGYAALEEKIAQLSQLPVVPPEVSAQIETSRTSLDMGQAQINQGYEELASRENELNNARTEYEKNRKELIKSQREYDNNLEKANKEIEESIEELNEAQEDLSRARDYVGSIKKPKWYILDREKMYGIEGYNQNAGRMDSLGNVFPVLFFLVAALVSLTAMTRMVNEQRIQIGTMKGLGYGTFFISGRYMWYAFLAAILGSIIGIAFGEWFFPTLIIKSYKIMYTGLPYILTPINWGQAILAIVSATGSIGIATAMSCIGQLRETPADLMRPKTPRIGKRILLEKWGIIWNRLDFTGKSTARNLFRYKKRLIMTVIGVGGCMALLLVGFGLKDSIQVIAREQYINIFKYEAEVSLNKESEEADVSALINKINGYEGVSSSKRVLIQAVDLISNSNTKEVNIFVPENAENIEEYLNIRDRVTNKEYEFPMKNAAISEKAAKMLDIKTGDIITIRNGDEEAKIKIDYIIENYVKHYIIFSKNTYSELFDKKPVFNTLYVNYDKESISEADFASSILKEEACLGISFVTDLENEIDKMLSVLDPVTYVLIAAAGFLSFIVLYNLNSINIMERRRELATLKVLGFYDEEVSMYIFRENIVLTILGTGLGIALGMLLHQYVVVTVEVDLMMFGRMIRWQSFVISGIINAGFTLLVNIYMHFHIRKINMVESLKSVE